MNVRMIHTEDEEAFVQQSVTLMTRWIGEAIADHSVCILGLSGGSTPRPVYEELGKKKLPWSKVKIFLVDERYVPADHEEGNQRMVRETLLAEVPSSKFHVKWRGHHVALRQAPKKSQAPSSKSHVDIPTVVFPDTSLPIDDCILKYSKDLKKCGIYSERLPDILTLGLGNDGHIASLFPPLSSLAMGDRQFVLHTTTDQFPVHDRITISLNAILSATHPIFFLRGEGKKRVWEEMMASSQGALRWPAKGVIEQGRATAIIFF